MKAKSYLLGASLLLAAANASSAAPSISALWLAGEAQTPFDTPHYYQSGSFSVSSGALVYLKVFAGGSAPISYQWRLYGTNLPGATCNGVTSCTYGYPGANLVPGDYTVVVKDASGISVTSQVATLTIDPTFTKIVSDPIVNTPDFATGTTWGDFMNCDTNPPSTSYPGAFVCNALSNNTPTTSSLYVNNGDGTFTGVTSSPPVSNPAIATSACWGDYDNDGYLDLFVSSIGPSFLYHNEGSGSFTQITGQSIVTDAASDISGSSWADYDQDGFLDMYVTRFDGNLISTCFLYRNNGDGTFTSITDSALVADFGSALGSVWCDYDGDGKIDLFVCGGGGPSAPLTRNRLYHNNGDGTFTKMVSAGDIVTDLCHTGNAAWGDYDNDGNPDLLILNLPPQTHYLYHNNGNGTFTRVTNTIVINNPSGKFDIGNGSYTCAWGDYDNDGFLDLVVTEEDGSAPYPNFIYHNNGNGTFTKLTTGSPVNEFAGSYGCSWVDYNNDGFIDLFASRTFGEGHALYRNNGNTNAWLAFKLIGTVSNRSAIGAKVRVKAFYKGALRWQWRQITGGTGWLGHNDLIANFGLGDATNAETVRIEWPSGTVQEFHNVVPRQILSITEPPRLFATATNGTPQFFLKGGRFMQYDIEASTDFTSWSPIGSVSITDMSGIAQIIDSAPLSDHKFYRAISH